MEYDGGYNCYTGDGVGGGGMMEGITAVWVGGGRWNMMEGITAKRVGGWGAGCGGVEYDGRCHC